MAVTSLMSLKLSTPGVTAEPLGSQNDQDNWAILDVHDHSSGKGTQIPTSGININANLSLGGYSSYNTLATTFNSQSSSLSTSNKPCVYVLNGDLRYINSSGDDVQLTNGSSVAGTAGSVSGITGNVSAGFSTDTFIWKTNSSTDLKAKMSNSDIKLYEYSAGVSNFVTLQSPAALAASYTVTFPAAVPGSTQYVTMSSAGALSTATADSIAAAVTSTGADAIAATITSTGANAIVADVTRATGTTVSAGGVALSTGTGSTSDMSPGLTYTDVTNLTVTITTSGRPVYLAIQPDNSGGGVQSSYITPAASGTAGSYAEFMFLRDGVGVSYPTRKSAGYGTSVNNTTPSGSAWIQFIDNPAAGTYTYKLQAKYVSFGGTAPASEILVRYVRLVAFEL